MWVGITHNHIPRDPVSFLQMVIQNIQNPADASEVICRVSLDIEIDKRRKA
jgi:hypothetical protein